MEDVNLYNFAKSYFVVKNRYSEGKKEAIVRVFPYIKLETNAEPSDAFYRQECLLRIPFRVDIDNLLYSYKDKGINSWKELYTASNLTQSDSIILQESELDEEIEDVEPLDDGLRQNLIEMNCGIGKTVNKGTIGRRLIDVSNDWGASRLNNPKYEEVLMFLEQYKDQAPNKENPSETNIEFSDEQKEVLKILDRQIDQIIEQQPGKRKKLRLDEIIKRCVVQGKAGSGKSTLIHEMVRRIVERLGKEYISICALTGAAAVNIHGNTLHAEFKLDLNSNNTDYLTGVNCNNFENDKKK